MKKKARLFQIILLVVAFITLISVTTYAYFTFSKSSSLSFKIATVNGNIDVKGADNAEITTNENFTYIDSFGDMLNADKHQMLDDIATKINVKIDFANSFATRVNIKLQEENGALPVGLIYVITTDGESLSSVLNSFAGATNVNDLRSKVYTYNHNKLKGLYENNLYEQTEEAISSNQLVQTTMNLSIYLWGDYYSLPGATDLDASTGENGNTYYLDRSYEFELSIKVMQAKDKYGGGQANYEND